VQVTAKLAALYVQTIQQPELGVVHPLAFEALHLWVCKADKLMEASPRSHAAAAVCQQLQESQLLQHMSPAMDVAAARLKAATAALAAASTTSSSSSSDGSSSRHGKGTGGGGSSSGDDGCVSNAGSTNISAPSSTEPISMQQLALNAAGQCFHSGCMLQLYMACYMAANTQSAPGTLSMKTALPAAPAAIRLALTVFQNHPMQPQEPLLGQSSELLYGACVLILDFAARVGGNVPRVLQSCPEASELLLLPELVSCLATMLVVVVLGLDTSTDGTEAQPSSRQERQQQQQADSSSGSGSSSGVNNGVQLNSLTPLSCSLFDMLGVTKGTALQAARLAHSQGSTKMTYFKSLMRSYESVLKYQVSLLRCCPWNNYW
jgi:hypothetical protein